MTAQPQNNPQSDVQNEQEELKAARLYFRWMLENDAHTDLIPNVGRWEEACRAIHAVHKIGGRAAARQAFNALCKNDPSLMIVVSSEEDTLTYPLSPSQAAPVVEPAPIRQKPTPAYQKRLQPIRVADLMAEYQKPAPIHQEPLPMHQEPLPIRQEPAPTPQESAPVRESVHAVVANPPLEAPATLDDGASTSLSYKPLPVSMRWAEEVGSTACRWLDAYIEFSKQWSPRGYEGFHEAVGLWVLSTVAARRVMVPLGDKRYTPLQIVLVGRTGLFAKSTTAKKGRAVLKSAGLDWMLAPDDATPQKFISQMAGTLPSNYTTLTLEEQQQIELQLAFAGQRGWFYDEFGQIMSAIMKDTVMSDFRSILRRMDDCYEKYEYATISRGSETIRNPYLALLGSMTPDDLRKAAKRGSSLWGDGFLARFAFVTPPAGSSGMGRFPAGLRMVPDELSRPLREWHERLGVPSVTIRPLMDEKGKPLGGMFVERTELPEQCCTDSQGVIDAHYSYYEALTKLRAASGKDHELDGNYNRFADKALRIAMLLASLENDGSIEMRHWARGQAICERWRANIHELFAQVNEAPVQEDEVMEDKILSVIAKLKLASVREIRQRIYGIDAIRLRVKVRDLAQAGMLEEVECEKSTRYRIPTTSSTVEA